MNDRILRFMNRAMRSNFGPRDDRNKTMKLPKPLRVLDSVKKRNSAGKCENLLDLLNHLKTTAIVRIGIVMIIENGNMMAGKRTELITETETAANEEIGRKIGKRIAMMYEKEILEKRNGQWTIENAIVNAWTIEKDLTTETAIATRMNVIANVIEWKIGKKVVMKTEIALKATKNELIFVTEIAMIIVIGWIATDSIETENEIALTGNGKEIVTVTVIAIVIEIEIG
ncbi:hypothetical protein O3G_MSEX000612 [Manduca sexta]|nr:hypothetical protein O3G_MSEX000612 [Manduca sexta]